MNQQEARTIAERVLDETVRPSNDDVIIVDQHTRESAHTWAFVYNTRAYVETGSFEDMLIGNAPLFVDKSTGRTRFGRTDVPLDAQLGQEQS
jgi:Immunity protein 35